MVGKSWAIVFARAGHPVRLYDVFPEAAAKSIPAIHAMGQQLKDADLLGDKTASADELVSRIRAASTLEEALEDVIWVQECAPETVELKKQAFADIERALLSEAVRAKFPDQLSQIIVASSSSAIPSSSFTNELSQEVKSRCLIAHPVNPVHLIPLIELVPAPYTDPSVTVKAREILEKVGKKPIVVKKRNRQLHFEPSTSSRSERGLQARR